MKQKLLSLGLSLALVLGLAAGCAPKAGPEESPAPGTTPPAAESMTSVEMKGVAPRTCSTASTRRTRSGCCWKAAGT